MNIREGLVMGMLEIRTHKLRSFLSFLGVMVGVGSVMLTLGFLRGMQEKMRKGIELSGPGRFEINLTQLDDQEREEDRKQVYLTLDDANAIRAKFPELPMVSPVASYGTNFAIGDVRGDVGVKAVTPEYSRRDWVYAIDGRDIDQHDLDTGARVCVIIRKGEPGKRSWWRKYYADYLRDPIDKAFQRYEVLDKDILLYDRLFRVVGVLREPNEDDDPRWFRGWDWQRVFIPLSTFHKYFGDGRDGRVSSIEVDTGSETSVPFYTQQIRKLLAARHESDDKYFAFRNRAEMMQASMKETRVMGYVFMAVGLISLLAGGIGIMNVSLAVVYSRIREIGIRRAVGARRMDILVQFVLEALLLAMLGGLAGVALGAVGIWQVPKYLREVNASVTPGIVAACLLISMAVGLFFSIYPAWLAAKLDPIEALRYE